MGRAEHRKKEDFMLELLRILGTQRWEFDEARHRAFPLPHRGRTERGRPVPRVALRSTRGYQPAPPRGEERGVREAAKPM